MRSEFPVECQWLMAKTAADNDVRSIVRASGHCVHFCYI